MLGNTRGCGDITLSMTPCLGGVSTCARCGDVSHPSPLRPQHLGHMGPPLHAVGRFAKARRKFSNGLLIVPLALRARCITQPRLTRYEFTQEVVCKHVRLGTIETLTKARPTVSGPPERLRRRVDVLPEMATRASCTQGKQLPRTNASGLAPAGPGSAQPASRRWRPVSSESEPCGAKSQDMPGPPLNFGLICPPPFLMAPTTRWSWTPTSSPADCSDSPSPANLHVRRPLCPPGSCAGDLRLLAVRACYRCRLVSACAIACWRAGMQMGWVAVVSLPLGGLSQFRLVLVSSEFLNHPPHKPHWFCTLFDAAAARTVYSAAFGYGSSRVQSTWRWVSLSLLQGWFRTSQSG